jgi:broad specificity phosphatase PhoE
MHYYYQVMERENGHHKETLIEDPLRIRVFLIRHGEQSMYTDTNSSLTSLGQQQIGSLAEKLCSQFEEEGNNKRLRVLHSPRPRAYESAQILSNFLKDQTRKNGPLYGSKVKRPMVWNGLQTADAIGPLLDDGVPRENVCAAWLNLPEETLQEYGARSPGQIQHWLLEQTEELEGYSKFINRFQPQQPEINILWISHETSIWSTLLLNPEINVPDTPVNHASYVQINIAHGSEPTKFLFQGQQFYPNGNHTEERNFII